MRDGAVVMARNRFTEPMEEGNSHMTMGDGSVLSPQSSVLSP